MLLPLLATVFVGALPGLRPGFLVLGSRHLPNTALHLARSANAPDLDIGLMSGINPTSRSHPLEKLTSFTRKFGLQRFPAVKSRYSSPSGSFMALCCLELCWCSWDLLSAKLLRGLLRNCRIWLIIWEFAGAVALPSHPESKGYGSPSKPN